MTVHVDGNVIVLEKSHDSSFEKYNGEILTMCEFVCAFFSVVSMRKCSHYMLHRGMKSMAYTPELS